MRVDRRTWCECVCCFGDAVEESGNVYAEQMRSRVMLRLADDEQLEVVEKKTRQVRTVGELLALESS